MKRMYTILLMFLLAALAVSCARPDHRIPYHTVITDVTELKNGKCKINLCKTTTSYDDHYECTIVICDCDSVNNYSWVNKIMK